MLILCQSGFLKRSSKDTLNKKAHKNWISQIFLLLYLTVKLTKATFIDTCLWQDTSTTSTIKEIKMEVSLKCVTFFHWGTNKGKKLKEFVL